MTNQAKMIVDKMMTKDLFTKWLGIERLEEREGYCKLKMIIREEMCNGFDIAHGGICYSLADSALSFASNSHGKHALSIETSISHLIALKSGTVVYATAKELSLRNHLGHYEVRIETEDKQLAAFFKGTVFLKNTSWTNNGL